MNAPPEEAEAHSRVSKRENRLYVGNLSYSCTYRDLRDFMMGGALLDNYGSGNHKHTMGSSVRSKGKEGGNGGLTRRRLNFKSGARSAWRNGRHLLEDRCGMGSGHLLGRLHVMEGTGLVT